MDVNQIWNTIIKGLNQCEKEFQTSTGIWFSATSDVKNVYVDKAVKNVPSSKISKTRKITKNDFSTVYQYYERWISGEKGIRSETREKSRNTAYIFAIISNI